MREMQKQAAPRRSWSQRATQMGTQRTPSFSRSWLLLPRAQTRLQDITQEMLMYPAEKSWVVGLTNFLTLMGNQITDGKWP